MLLAAPWAAIKAQGIPLISFWQAPATSFYRVHNPKIFGDDASTRRITVVESIKAGKPIVGVEPAREALSIFGMTPVMHDGKTLGNVDIGVAFGKEFVDRAKKRFGIDLAGAGFQFAIVAGGILLGRYVDVTKQFKSVSGLRMRMKY